MSKKDKEIKEQISEQIKQLKVLQAHYEKRLERVDKGTMILHRQFYFSSATKDELINRRHRYPNLANRIDSYY